MKIIRNSFILILFLTSSISNAQYITEFQKGFQLNIQPTIAKIEIDGILDEPVWANTDVAKDFKKKYLR